MELKQGGIYADEFLERESGGVHHKAVMLAELGSAVEASRAEWEYEGAEEAVQLVRLCAALDDYLKDLSILPDGTITRWRQCQRCSGAGETRGESPCIECRGRGAVHADEADS